MTPYETAVLLAARGLIAVPLYPVGPDGLCTCGWASCEGRHVRHHAGKHVRPVPGFGAAAPPLSWWRHQADTPAGIDRRASRVVTAEDDGDLAAWARAERMPLPPTFTLASPRRRLRLFYRLPEGFGPARSMVQVDGWQVDIIAWVSAPGPGVRNSEGEYRLVRDVPVAPAPAPLLAYMADYRHRPGAPVRPGDGRLLLAAAIRRARRQRPAGDGH